MGGRKMNVSNEYELINTEKADAAINHYLNTPEVRDRWILANQTLYDLCQRYPDHKNEDQIVAKIWLIGRSYAAAIERRKNADGYVGDFYYDTVAPYLKSVGEDLDSKMKKLNSSNSIDDLLDTHARLMEIFNHLTGMDKRSLASKYLHFHCPDAVFIYDSVAKRSLSKMVKKPKNISEYLTGDRDAGYVDFCLRAIELRRYISHKYGKDLTVRQIDTLLLRAPI